MSDAPLPPIAVGILSHNRVTEVLTTIDIIRSSDYPPDQIHLVVLDNDSADGTAETVLARYAGDVEVLRLPENLGAIARNRAMLDRDEPYIFVFDEDCAPERPDTLRRAVRFMEQHRHIGAFSLYSINAVTGREECQEWDSVSRRRLPGGGLEGVYVTGNGMLFRRDAIRRTSGYDQRIFWGSEEFCLALELLYHDIPIACDPTIRLVHRRAPRAMPVPVILEAEARNNIWASLLHLPLPIALLMAVVHSIRRVISAFRHARPHGPAAVARGVRQAIKGLPDIMSARKIIPVSRLARHNRWFVDVLLR